MNIPAPRDPGEALAGARYELKFVAPSRDLDIVLNWLRLHRAGFSQPYSGRWINSIYFDTHDYAAAADKLAGLPDRAKVRYRWYGFDRTPQPGALEVKYRRGALGFKVTYPVGERLDAASWRGFCGQLDAALPGAGRRWLMENPLPVVLACYYRRYFASADGRIRATVDTEQTFYDQRFRTGLDLTRPLPGIGETMVLEVKVGSADREAAVACLATVPMRATANSKYVAGLLRARGA
jgi:hypothetical protein